MPRNVFSDIKLHVVWHVKNSERVIRPDLEVTVHDVIRRRAIEAENVFVHEIGGTADHVHLAVTVPPTLLISEWIGKVKGGASHDVNEARVFPFRFEWQTGYGVVSFSSNGLPWVRKYIRDQREHHKTNTIKDVLERIERLDA
jgi:REP element-mobilizing transposase RayT